MKILSILLLVILNLSLAQDQSKYHKISSKYEVPKYIYLENFLLTDDLEIERLKDKTSKELRYIRNAIFAKYGYIFKTESLNQYFSQFDWYHPRFKNVDSLLTANDIQNVQIIRNFENLAPDLFKKNLISQDMLTDTCYVQIFENEDYKTIETKQVQYKYISTTIKDSLLRLLLAEKINHRFQIDRIFKYTTLQIKAYSFDNGLTLQWEKTGNYSKSEIYEQFLLLPRSNFQGSGIQIDVLSLFSGKKLFSCNDKILKCNGTRYQYLISLNLNDIHQYSVKGKTYKKIANLQVYDLNYDYLHQYAVETKDNSDCGIFFIDDDPKIIGNELISSSETSLINLKCSDKNINLRLGSNGIILSDPIIEQNIKITRIFSE